jgi:hypothetical protein
MFSLIFAFLFYIYLLCIDQISRTILYYFQNIINIQSVPGGKVIIPGGHSKQKSVNVHGSYPEQLPRQSYFTVQEFGYGTQYCPLLSPYCAPLDFCIWGLDEE